MYLDSQSYMFYVTGIETTFKSTAQMKLFQLLEFRMHAKETHTNISKFVHCDMQNLAI